MDFTALGNLLIMALLIETVIEAVKPALNPLFSALSFLEKYSINPYLYLSMGFGIILAFAYEVDLFAQLLGQEPLGITTLSTGLVVGRGANFVHDLAVSLLGATKKLSNLKAPPPA